MKNKFTPDNIETLKSNEIFVFGSNKEGMHIGGAASHAFDNFGAVWGQGEGLFGQSYAIPTMDDEDVNAIQPYVDRFIEFAKLHKDLTFLVTKIGCGIAGFTPEEVAPLFKDAIELENVILPEEFVKVLE